jgi:conjugative relaxase-like TrwC/TraI family protein
MDDAMMTVVTHKNLAGAEDYFSEHLAQNDYYAAGEIQPGEWIGEGAIRLNLVGEVNRDAFVALCENRDPKDGTRLTQRQKAEGERRVFYDFTCSAPKSVSILAVTFEDRRLVEAHSEAAKVALYELERFAAARVRQGNTSTDRETGNIVAAQFLHTSSRALDPQLHTHFTVFNATWDGVEHRWKALQAGQMFAATRYATQVYRNELVRRIHEIGYRTVPIQDRFEIEGVQEALIRSFSKRSAERDHVVKDMAARLGRELSNDEVSYAVHRSRQRKLTGISSAEVRTRQLAQIEPEEREYLARLRDVVQARNLVQSGDEILALNHAVAHVFERKSVVAEHEILEAALGHRPGSVDLDRIKGVLRMSPELVVTDRGISTREILRQELRIIELVREGKASSSPLRVDYSGGAWLGDDQKAALLHVLQSADRVVGIRGLAGTGKTTVLKELKRACEDAGFDLRFCAPTAAATEVLRKEGLEAVTLARLLQTSRDRPPAIIVLDEAGAVGVSDMMKLLQHPGRVVLCGDTGQHSPVAQGDALRLIEEHSPFSFGALTNIRRQRPAEYRHAVQLAANGDPEGAFGQLERMGAIQELPKDQMYILAAAEFMRARKAGRSALIVAPTWKEIESVSDQVRSALRAEGALRGQEQEIDVFDSLSWTAAQKADATHYRPGQQVRFHHAQGGFARQETVEVVSVDPTVSVRRGDGSVATLDPPLAARCIDVGDKRRLRVAAGDRLLLQANAPSFTNGELVEVSAIAADRIHLADGRELTRDYRTFTYGYAITSHAAQGKTVDEVFVVTSSRSAGAIHREQFYVSISRARERCLVSTDDREVLRSQIGRSSSRMGAVDAVNRTNAVRQSLIRRAIQLAQSVPLRLRLWARHREIVRRKVHIHRPVTQHRSIIV